MSRRAPADDIEFMLAQTKSIVPNAFHHERVLLTGATGFFGKWLTQYLLAANDAWALDNHLTIVSRDQTRALSEMPWLRDRADVTWINTDIRELSGALKNGETFTSVLHGAAAASRDLNENRPTEMFDTIVEGTRQALTIAAQQKAKFLLISSGAVYGAQPPSMSHVPETYLGAPDPLDFRASYGEAKRVAEMLSASLARKHGFEVKIARCFAFIGPYLPLDSHFAAGNFVGNVLKSEPIRIGGDGTPLRSYLYAADLVVWLMTVFLKGKSLEAYNVGSDHAISIKDLAILAIKTGRTEDFYREDPPLEIARVAHSAKPRESYVPSIERAKAELGLKVETDLPAALKKTLLWHRNQA